MFPLKTLKTKKKSYEITWEWYLLSSAIFSLFSILTFSIRAILIPSSYGGVTLEIPTINININDNRLHNFSEKSINFLNPTTPTIILTSSGFYFGALSSFSRDFATQKRFLVKHHDGHPMLGNLLHQLEKWIKHRSEHENIPNEKILLLIPSAEIPIPIITQVIDEIKNSHIIARVVLGGGIR